MARSILLAATIAWLLAGLAGLGLAAVGIHALESALPPLAIDTDALRGAVVAFAIALLATGVAHAAVVVGLRLRRAWASSAAILLAALLGMTSLALAAAAGTSAAATPGAAPTLIATSAIAGLAALAYGLAAYQLIGERRSGAAN